MQTGDIETAVGTESGQTAAVISSWSQDDEMSPPDAAILAHRGGCTMGSLERCTLHTVTVEVPHTLSTLGCHGSWLLQEKRKTIGMRVPSNPIAQALLETLGEPMLSTSLMLPGSDFTESDPEEIKDRLEKVVDLIIHGGFLGQQPTTVIDLTEDTPVVLREGVGDVRPFL